MRTEDGPDLDETLPDTQPCGDLETYNEAYSQATQSQPYYGRLYPLLNGFRHYDLSEKSISVGRGSSCLIIIPQYHLEANLLAQLDDVHFEINRVFEGSRTLVKIHVLSQRGVYLNGQIVSSGQKSTERVLNNNDKIGLPGSKSGSHSNVFVYVDADAPQKEFIPKTVLQRYDVTFRLGKGAFGEVYLTFDKTDVHASAMKTIPYNPLIDDEKLKAKLLNEMNILKSLNHFHIVKLMKVLELKEGSYMFLEYVAGGDLSERIAKNGRLKEELAKLFFYQLAMGLKYLHDHNVIHRDIKPANVLLASAHAETLVKLTDFGLSKVLISTVHMKTKCGTKLYAAPELLSCEGNHGKYTALVDIWSLGVLLYVSLSGTEPFATEPHLIEKHIMQGLYVMPTEPWKNISVYAKNLIDSMLTVSVLKRIQIEGILADKWLKDNVMLTKLQKLYKFFGHENISE